MVAHHQHSKVGDVTQRHTYRWRDRRQKLSATAHQTSPFIAPLLDRPRSRPPRDLTSAGQRRREVRLTPRLDGDASSRIEADRSTDAIPPRGV